MDILLIATGVACLVAAIAGVGIKAAAIEIGAVASPRRQALLAVLGVVLVSAGWLAHDAAGSGTDEPEPANAAATLIPSKPPTQSTPPPPTPGPSSPAPPPLVGTGSPVRFIDPATIDVLATSELSPQGGNAYGPENTLDGDNSTAWCEGSPGSGAGQRLTYIFGEPILLRRMDVVNGYNKADRYDLNARPWEVEIATDHETQRATLRDSSGVQELPVPGTPTTSLSLTVRSVYEGSRFEDLCLSDIQFFGSSAG